MLLQKPKEGQVFTVPLLWLFKNWLKMLTNKKRERKMKTPRTEIDWHPAQKSIEKYTQISRGVVSCGCFYFSLLIIQSSVNIFSFFVLLFLSNSIGFSICQCKRPCAKTAIAQVDPWYAVPAPETNTPTPPNTDASAQRVQHESRSFIDREGICKPGIPCSPRLRR